MPSFFLERGIMDSHQKTLEEIQQLERQRRFTAALALAQRAVRQHPDFRPYAVASAHLLLTEPLMRLKCSAIVPAGCD